MHLSSFIVLVLATTCVDAQNTQDSLHVVGETVITGSRLKIPQNTTAIKMRTPLRKTPLGISVVDETLIETQDGATLSDALANVSGIGVHSNFGVHDLFYLRGFDSLNNGLVLSDGAPEPEATFYQLYNVERVESLKGPGAFLYGGNPLSGTINMVRKRPDTAGNFARINSSYGRFDHCRATLDAGRVVSDRLALRFNALWQDAGSYRDDKNSSIHAINPALTLYANERSTLNLDFEYLTSEHQSDAGLPILGDRLPAVPRTRSYQSPYDLSQQTIVRFRADYQWQLHDNVTLRDKFYYTNLDWPSRGTLFSGAFPNAVGSLELVRSLLDLNDQQTVVGNQLEGQFDLRTGGLAHQLLLGLEITDHTDDFTLDVALLSQIDIFTLDTILPPNLGDLFPPEAGTDSLRIPLPDQTTRGRTSSQTIAPYFVDHISFSSHFDVFLGGRFDRVDYEDQATATQRDYQQFSPMLGAVLTANEQLSIYANTSRAFAAPSARVVGDRKAEQSAQYEVGAKALLMGGKLNANIALFNLDKDNIAIPDDNGLTRQIGDQRARGLELELAGHPANGWYAQATYAFLDAELTRFNEFVLVPTLEGFLPQLFNRTGNAPAFAPEHLLTLWVARDFAEYLTLSGGARYVGSQFAAEDNIYQIDGAMTVDLGLTYRQGPALLRFNLKNITSNKFETRGFGATSVIPAAPLTFKTTLGYSL